MYARLLEVRAAATSQEFGRIVREELLPALRNEEGFCGALHLVNCDGGNGLMITFWETEAQAARSRDGLDIWCVEGSAAIATTGSARLRTVWEVQARA
jgi:hypothetical protein